MSFSRISTAAAVVLSAAAACCAVTRAGAATVYADSFTRSAALHASAPDTRPASQTWTAAAAMTVDGQEADVSGQSRAWLPVTFAAGNVYDVRVRTNPALGSSNWLGVGFGALDNTTIDFSNAGKPGPWMLMRGTRSSTGFQTFAFGTGGNPADHSSAGLNDYHELRVRLDTSPANWTAEWFVDGASIRSFTYTTNPALPTGADAGRVFIETNNLAGSFDDFRLDVTPVPEPTAAAGVAAVAAVTALRRRRTGGKADCI